MVKALKIIALITVFSLFINVRNSYSNNLSISNVSLEDRNPSSNTVVVEFDLSWENSWKTKINHDAVWLTVRLYNPSALPTDKKLCEISESGLNPNGSSIGSNSDIEIVVPNDKKGVFINPKAFGINSSMKSENVRLTIDYSTCGFSASDAVSVTVYGFEMVYVPEGSFYAGDFNTSNASLDEGSTDSDPWYISSEDLLTVSNPSANGYRYVSGGNIGEDATGSSFTLSASFPKGYGPFYTMKYEITEGQWVDFVNSLPSSARVNRDITDNTHKNTDTVQYRNTVSCSGTPLICTTERPGRALNYLSWMDLSAFMDWAALRPMTELEFEKISRGPLLPVAGEFSWGTTVINAATTISAGDEKGDEIITNSDANANYNNISFVGGDAVKGSNYTQGALRAGIFALSTSSRELSGSSYYGAMEMSGNVSERVVTIGNNSGRSFIGTNGDGILSSVSGYEGNATNADWPGIDDTPSRGITKAIGSGFKGGSWVDQSSGNLLRISDRSNAANTSTNALNYSGGRGVRSYE